MRTTPHTVSPKATSVEKNCKKCGGKKPIVEFALCKNNPDGHFSWCRACSSAYNKTRPARSNPAWRKTNNEKLWGYQLRRYGLTVADYNKRVEAQMGKCAICGDIPPSRKKRSLEVDHCHATGKVRELLCSKCNTLLGRVESRGVNLLNKVLNYMYKHSAVSVGSIPSYKTQRLQNTNEVQRCLVGGRR